MKSARLQIITFLERRGPSGATDEEIVTDLGLRANTVRPRRRELWENGIVRDSGKKRLTASGSPAIVWVLSIVVRKPAPQRSRKRALAEALVPFTAAAHDAARQWAKLPDKSVVTIRMSLGACRALINATGD